MFWDEKAECMNKEDKEKIQLERLQKTVQLAYENVEFYKKRFDEIGLKPEDIKTLKDIEKSKKYYHDLFGLNVVLDNDGNVIMTEGLVLQDEAIWKRFIGKEIKQRNNAVELYFEESDIEGFSAKLRQLYPDTEYVNTLMKHSWGQRVIRFYDPDGNLIEVGTPM